MRCPCELAGENCVCARASARVCVSYCPCNTASPLNYSYSQSMIKDLLSVAPHTNTEVTAQYITERQYRYMDVDANSL